jgi:hypothetical protein
MKQLYWLFCLLPTLGQAQDNSKTSPYDSAHFSWRNPVPRNRLRELQPDRPGVTESPFTVDAGHFQLEMDAFRLINSGSGNEDHTRSMHFAYSNLKLGLSRRTDLQLELPLYSVAKKFADDDAQREEERHAGFGDVTLRLKHNFVGDDQEGTFAAAAIGYVRFPTGGLTGEGAAEYGLVLPADIELSDKSNLEVQLETDLNYDRDQSQHYLRFMPSTAIEYDFTKKLGLVAEAVGQWNTQERRWQASANIAPILKLTENLQLDLGTHLALNRQSDHEYFVGFTFRR